MIDAGAVISGVDGDGNTALHLAAATKKILEEAARWGKANGYPVGKNYPQYADIRAVGRAAYRKDGYEGLQSILKSVQADGTDLYTYLDLLWNHLKNDEGDEIWLM